MARVLICNIGYNKRFESDITTLRQRIGNIPGVDLVEECGPFEHGVEYLQAHLPLSRLGVFLVPLDITEVPHMQSVIALNEQWENQSGLRKIQPIYVNEQHFQEATNIPEYLKNSRLYMDDPEFDQKLANILTANAGQQLSRLYPAYDCAAGLALNFFSGFCVNIMNEGFQRKYAEKCDEIERNALERKFTRCQKTALLIPGSCSFPRLENCDADFKNSITLHLKKEEFEGLPRPFTLPMHQLSRGEQTFLVRMDCPNILTTLYKLSESDTTHDEMLLGVTRLSTEQCGLQRDRFVHELKILMDLKHRDKYIIVEWNENSGVSVKDAVINAVIEDAAAIETNGVMQEPSAIVVWDPEQQSDDEEKITDIENNLKNNGIDVIEYKQLGKTEMDVMSEARIKKATQLLWVRGCTLTDTQRMILAQTVVQQDEDQRLQIIPIQVDGRPEDWQHSYLKGINHLEYTDLSSNTYSRFIKQLVKTCSVEMSLSYPLGPVFFGLAWTAILNYLVPFLPGKLEVVKKIQEDYCSKNKGDVILCDKLFVLSERHCRTIDGKAFGKFDGIELVDSGTVFANLSNDKRRYMTTVLAVTYQNKTYLVAVEYLRAMSSLGQFADCMQVQISPQKIMVQNARHNDLFRQIQQRIPALNGCVLLTYDDEAPENRENSELLMAKLLANCIEQSR